MFCRSELARLAKLNPRIEAAGAQTVVVTMGRPEETERFCGERAPGLRCFCDPEAASYRAYGLTRGTTDQLFGPAVWLKGAQVTLEGKFEGLPIGKPVGDPFQMPGMFVIGEDGRVSFAYYSKHAGDYPDDAEVLRAVSSTPDR
ncbi:MAG: peroxiredoxin-like family protein [Anaerolineae bacterium]|nr:peroxiredoxin-like family protein [Anaerolineae bacterium]